MKINYKSFLLVAIALLTASISEAAGRESGGGKLIVCRHKNGKIATAELLDLWEARKVHGFKIQPSKDTVPNQLRSALKALSESVNSDDIAVYANPVDPLKGADAVYKMLLMGAQQFLQPDPAKRDAVVHRLRNVHLNLTSDSYETVIPEKCAVEQAVIYTDFSYGVGSIEINQDLVDHLDPLNQAALLTHEVYYKWLRDVFAEGSSIRTRRAVGLAFSGHKFKALNKKYFPKEYYECIAPGDSTGSIPSSGLLNGASDFYIFPADFTQKSDQTWVTFQVSRLGGLTLIDNPPVLLDPKGGAFPALNFKDLSPLMSRHDLSMERDGIVQPELRPVFRVDEASPDGVLKISIAAPKSLFQPDGMSWRQATCQYHLNP